MDDLGLFRALRAGDAPAETLAPLLEELAELTLRERAPFLGWLDAALSHDDPRVRGAAVGAMRQAVGHRAFRALVRALDDRDESVRQRAVQSLHGSAVAQPERIAHAVFHERADVRRRVAELGPHRGGHHVRFHLVADPECAELVLDHPDLDAEALPALLDFVARGVISTERARAMVGRLSWDQASPFWTVSRGRSVADVVETLADSPVVAGADDLDGVLALFDEAEPDARRAFLARMSHALASPAHGGRRPRAAAALIATVRRRGCADALAVCAVIHPQVLLHGSLSLDARRAAVSGLYAAGRACPPPPTALAHSLLGSELARDRDGRLDLWALGGLLHLVPKRPYETLWGLGYEPDAVVERFLEDVTRFAPFLGLEHGASERGRGWLMKRIVGRASSRRPELVAALTAAAPANELWFLDDVADEELMPVVEALYALEDRPGTRLSDNKVRHLAAVLARRLARADRVGAHLRGWLERREPARSRLGIALLVELSRHLETEPFVETLLALPTPRLRCLLDLLPVASGVPWGKEVALAVALRDSVSASLRDWAELRAPSEPPLDPAVLRVASDAVVTLDAATQDRIETCADHALAAAVAPALAAPCRGLAAPLSSRPSPELPHVDVCAALLACHDDVAAVAEQLERFGWPTDEHRSALDARAVGLWQGVRSLPVLGHAWLWRFEAHALALVGSLLDAGHDLRDSLDAATAIPSSEQRRNLWRGVGRALSIFRYRDRERLLAAATPELADLAVARLDTDVGVGAAHILVALHGARFEPEHLDALRARVLVLLPDLTDDVRSVLRAWVSASGLPARARPARSAAPDPSDELLARVRVSTDLDELGRLCRAPVERIVQEAALRLVELGEPGQAVLVALLGERPTPSSAASVAESVGLWSPGPALDAARELVRDAALPAALRFRLAVELAGRGERALVAAATAIASEPGDPGWFRPRDWARIVELAGLDVAAASLCASAHPNAYLPAVDRLLEHPAGDAIALEAVRRFLAQGRERMGELRRRAAWWLHDAGLDDGWPLLVEAALCERERPERLFVMADDDLVERTVMGALTAGSAAVPERALVVALEARGVEPAARDRGLRRLLTDAAQDATRTHVVAQLRHRPTRDVKLRAVAEVFAWGVRVGREMTGRRFRFHMIADGKLGWTRLSTNHIHVTPLPILRGERHGRDLVEALVLHEIGHHVHHRGEEQARIWQEAQRRGIGGLLNLVADEHLERNLRSVDAGYGDRLKRLAAWAFRHSTREIPVRDLLAMLQGQSFEVLTRCRLRAARDAAAVRVDNGPLLQEMERAGMRFAKFVRALRMGLGRRHEDPVVDEALGLFGKAFRRGDMQRLLDVTVRLRELFGWETRLVEHFGGHESIEGDARDQLVHGEGITDAEVQEEVERILAPPSASGPSRPGDERRPRLAINVGPDESFSPIALVQPVPFDLEAHREHAARVARSARQMRRWLEELGLSLEPEHGRLRGHRFDRGRLREVITRGDPRMLIAREPVLRTDLFLGVVVDCSGSMRGASMHRARLFGTLLAEAAAGLPGVDLRVFGFTDRTIFDCGDARRCSVASLEADGGNNDAAGLFHAALAARKSRRAAKLLVMISDGLPTECSVAALRALVRRLGREGMCCAQVAVRPLEEICFPHYVEVQDDDPGAAVRRFGTIVARLVRRAMRG